MSVTATHLIRTRPWHGMQWAPGGGGMVRKAGRILHERNVRGLSAPPTLDLFSIAYAACMYTAYVRVSVRTRCVMFPFRRKKRLRAAARLRSPCLDGVKVREATGAFKVVRGVREV